MTTAQPDPSALFWRLVRQVRPCWPHLTGLFLLSLLAPPLALLTPVPLKIVFDSVIDNQRLPRFLSAMLPHNMSSSAGSVLTLAVALILIVAFLSQVRDSLSGL